MKIVSLAGWFGRRERSSERRPREAGDVERLEPRSLNALRWAKLAAGALGCGVGAAVMSSVPALAATSTAPGLSVFSGISSWVSQYGLAGAPVAISLGGLLFAVEHHQQRTGNAIRAKGYIFAAAAGLIVISMASTITSAESS